MSAPIVVVCLWLLATGTGSIVALPRARIGLTRLEVMLYSSAIGLGIVAYALFILGAVGGFSARWMLTLGTVLLPPAAVGWFRLSRFRPPGVQAPDANAGPAWVPAAAGFVLAITLGAALVQCFMPPGAHEWDSLSYHLAAPKAFLRAGRLIELPTDHHSYFPFLAQMLFAVGLAFDGYSAAKLVHFMFGLLSVGATLALASRHLPTWAAWLATLIVGLAPMAVWESGIAYIELAQTFYVTLALHGLLRLMETRDRREAAASGTMCGLALAVKTLSLIPVVGLVCLAALKTRARCALLVALPALIVGSPFYIRTWALTGNPVYPFAFSVFGGKNWDAERARLYASEHTGFGLNAALPSLADDLKPARSPYVAPSVTDRLRNLALAPFMLVAAPRIFHNYNDPSPHNTLGFLWLALLPLALLPRTRGVNLAVPAMLLAFWYVTWSASMQYMRYLIPALPIAALMGAAGAYRLAASGTVPRAAFAVLVAVQAGMLWAHTLPQAFADLQTLRSPEGIERAVARGVNVYAAQTVLNASLSESQGVVLFEETRGFYLDRPVMWGNSPHSAYIPYDRFRDAEDMAKWFVARGYPYALINLQFAPQASTEDGASQLREAVRANREPELMLRWYGDAASGTEAWRRLIGNAVREGHASFVREACMNGAVVIRFVTEGGAEG